MDTRQETPDAAGEMTRWSLIRMAGTALIALFTLFASAGSTSQTGWYSYRLQKACYLRYRHTYHLRRQFKSIPLDTGRRFHRFPW